MGWLDDVWVRKIFMNRTSFVQHSNVTEEINSTEKNSKVRKLRWHFWIFTCMLTILTDDRWKNIDQKFWTLSPIMDPKETKTGSEITKFRLSGCLYPRICLSPKCLPKKNLRTFSMTRVNFFKNYIWRNTYSY